MTKMEAIKANKEKINELLILAEKYADNNNYCDFSKVMDEVESLKIRNSYLNSCLKSYSGRQYGNPHDFVPSGSPCRW